MAILFSLIYTFGLSVTRWFWFCRYPPSRMFLSLDILFEYWIEHVTIGLLYVRWLGPTGSDPDDTLAAWDVAGTGKGARPGEECGVVCWALTVEGAKVWRGVEKRSRWLGFRSTSLSSLEFWALWEPQGMHIPSLSRPKIRVIWFPGEKNGRGGQDLTATKTVQVSE